MARIPPRALTSNRLLVCALINQLATPGLGSWAAGRRVAGAGQLVLAVAGFVLITVWMMETFYAVFAGELGEPTTASAPEWMWKWGWWLFGAGWIWALVTSVELFLQARTLQNSAKIPPRIPGPPSSPGSGDRQG